MVEVEGWRDIYGDLVLEAILRCLSDLWMGVKVGIKRSEWNYKRQVQLLTT